MNFIKSLFSFVIAIFDFITKYFKTIVFLTIIIYLMDFSNVEENANFKEANLAKIELFGPIMDPSSVLEKIEKAKQNENIKGVLLIVNSPGGAVAPSIELAYAIKELKQIKPVVAYASGTMASGSYYASIWADKIYANPGSMIGSIGVIFQSPNVEKLMEEIGITTQTIKAGRFKEAGTATRTWNNYEKGELEKIITDTYDMFITDVAMARKLKKQNHKEFADAHIFTSRQAKKVGLIDSVATISHAQNSLYKLSKITDPVWEKEDKFDKFMEKIISQTITNFSTRLLGDLKAY